MSKTTVNETINENVEVMEAAMVEEGEAIIAEPVAKESVFTKAVNFVKEHKKEIAFVGIGLLAVGGVYKLITSGVLEDNTVDVITDEAGNVVITDAVVEEF